jgi:hypothetical protein
MIPLKDVVKEYMLMRGLDSMHMFPKYLQYGISAMRDMHFDVSGVPNAATISLQEGSSAVVLPENLVKLLRVGMVNSEGMIVEIHPTDKLVVGTDGAYSQSNPNRAINATDSYSLGAYSTPDLSTHVTRGEVYGRYYGNEGGSVYKYRLSRSQNVIQFSSNVSGDIVIEYLASPEKVDGQHMVHEFIVNAVHAYIDWASIKFKRNIPANEKVRAHSYYVTEKHNSRVRFMTLTIGNIINESRKTFNQGPKY